LRIGAEASTSSPSAHQGVLRIVQEIAPRVWSFGARSWKPARVVRGLDVEAFPMHFLSKALSLHAQEREQYLCQLSKAHKIPGSKQLPSLMCNKELYASDVGLARPVIYLAEGTRNSPAGNSSPAGA
jgi:hypothetical protein